MADVAVERGREQHRLVLARDLAQDPFHLRSEAVVGHAVSLVEHEHLDLIEIEFVVLEQIDEPQWCGDDNFDAVVQHVDLTVTRRPAVHREHAEAAGFGDRLEHIGHLQRELAGGHEDEATRLVRLRLAAEAGEQRHAEGQRLSRSGAGPAAHVGTGERHGNCLGLDRERLRETGSGEAGIDLGGHAERRETGWRVDGWR